MTLNSELRLIDGVGGDEEIGQVAYDLAQY